MPLRINPRPLRLLLQRISPWTTREWARSSRRRSSALRRRTQSSQRRLNERWRSLGRRAQLNAQMPLSTSCESIRAVWMPPRRLAPSLPNDQLLVSPSAHAVAIPRWRRGSAPTAGIGEYRYRRSAIPAQRGSAARHLRAYAPPSTTARRSSAHSTTSGIRGQPPRHASRREQPGHAPRMRSRNRLNAELLHASAIVVGLSCTS